MDTPAPLLASALVALGRTLGDDELTSMGERYLALADRSS